MSLHIARRPDGSLEPDPCEREKYEAGLYRFREGYNLQRVIRRTEGLMNSIPRLSTPTHTRLDAIPGAVPHPLKLPKGCKFAPRCKYATERCLNEEPEMIHVSETQQVRCFYPRKEDRHGKK